MRNAIVLMFVLSGCTTLSSYQPQLASAPTNQEAYQSDLQACRNAARTSGTQALGAVFGGVGALTEGVVGQECSSLKSSFTCVDECMSAKGYKLYN